MTTLNYKDKTYELVPSHTDTCSGCSFRHLPCHQIEGSMGCVDDIDNYRIWVECKESDGQD